MFWPHAPKEGYVGHTNLSKFGRHLHSFVSTKETLPAKMKRLVSHLLFVDEFPKQIDHRTELPAKQTTKEESLGTLGISRSN